VASRELLKHHQKCTSTSCPVCTPVKQYVQKQRMQIAHRQVGWQRRSRHGWELSVCHGVSWS
jgi:hypothetical protein